MLRILLFPFALLYGLATGIRNWLFDRGVLRSETVDVPTICVGNLAVGGTGKTPHTEYVLDALRRHFRVAVLSRGYKRHTQGFVLAGAGTDATQVGDEPYQMFRKYPDVRLAVDERRVHGVRELLRRFPGLDVVVLDDALQHRAIRPGLTVLLTDYARLYTRDWPLPAGRLREWRSGSRRADLIVVSKCPADLSIDERRRICREIAPREGQSLYFSTYRYRPLQAVFPGVNPDTFTPDGSTGILLVAGISFLFTTVAANAIAIVGTNPVSGMTLMTLILASVIMVAVGLKGASGMVAALVMGGVVCTALSMAGGFITDLKIGYWLGSTPRKQEGWKFLGTLVSAATVGGVIMVLNESYGFTSGDLAAPQANAMAAVIDPLMNGVGAPWLLYGIGAALALVLTFCKVPALAFALGMFIPLELNLPLLMGGLINWFVTTRSKDEGLNNARKEKGTLLASGFIAGGALMGVVSAILRYCEVNLVAKEWLANPLSQAASLLAYALLIFYFVRTTLNIKQQEQ